MLASSRSLPMGPTMWSEELGFTSLCFQNIGLGTDLPQMGHFPWYILILVSLLSNSKCLSRKLMKQMWHWVFSVNLSRNNFCPTFPWNPEGPQPCSQGYPLQPNASTAKFLFKNCWVGLWCNWKHISLPRSYYLVISVHCQLPYVWREIAHRIWSLDIKVVFVLEFSKAYDLEIGELPYMHLFNWK